MSQTPIRSIAARVAPVLLLAGLVAGCGDDGDTGAKDNADKTSASASTSTSESTSPETDSSEDTSSQSSGTALTKDNITQPMLAAQKKAGSARSTQTTEAAGTKLAYESETRYDGDEVSTHVKTTADSSQQIELYLVDGIAYVKDAGIGDGTKWVKVDTKDPANQSGVLAPLALGADPEAALEAFGNPTAVKLVGPDDVEGVKTNHYKVTVSTANYAKALGLPAAATTALPPEITQDLWLDEDNRQVKTRVELAVQGQTSVTEQTFFDYGADVKITPPADGDTITPKEAQIPGY
ncbi:MAG: hypothetical protein L0H31_17160 [Nocardioidaceae bacterium]|nr:hypothetical protein [Nocardioidaceae bacterium]